MDFVVRSLVVLVFLLVVSVFVVCSGFLIVGLIRFEFVGFRHFRRYVDDGKTEGFV